MVEPVPRYQLGPRSRRGLIAGWRGGQLALVAGGLVIAVVVLRSASPATGAFGAFAIVAVFVALATWPLAGRSVEQWAPVVVGHLARRTGVPLRRRDALVA